MHINGFLSNIVVSDNAKPNGKHVRGKKIPVSQFFY